MCSLYLTTLEGTRNKEAKVSRVIAESQVSTIAIEKDFKIHGLALTSDGLKTKANPNDFVLVFLEVPEHNKISINELRIGDGALPPYQFNYRFIEWREYAARQVLNDPITKYQFVFDKDNMHIGVAQRKSMGFDIYYNGNFIDTATKRRNGE